MRHYARTAIVAASVSIVLVTALTIAGELAPVIKSALKAITGQGWVTKGLVGLILFVVLTTLLTSRQKEGDRAAAAHIYGLIVTAVVCGAVLSLFFVFHFVATQ